MKYLAILLALSLVACSSTPTKPTVEQLTLQNQALETELYVVLEQRAQLWDGLDQIRSIAQEDPTNPVATKFGKIAQDTMVNVDLLNNEDVQ